MIITAIGIILLATIARFAVGAIWYMPQGLFGKKWMALQNYTPSADEKGGGKAMGIGFAFSLLSTAIIGLMLSPLMKVGAVMGQSLVMPVILFMFLLWLGFVVPTLAQRKIYNPHKNYSWSLFWIDATHELVAMIIAGLVLVWLL